MPKNLIEMTKQGKTWVQKKSVAAVGAGTALMVTAGSAMAEVSPKVTELTGQIGEDVGFIANWGFELFTGILLLVILMKLSKKWGNRGASA